MSKHGKPQQRFIQYGRKRIEYELRHSDRTTLAIEVNPDLSVVAVAPHGSDIEVVDTRMRKRAAWIIKQQREFELYLPQIPPRRFVSGESHRYLGRQYRLQVRTGESESVKMSRGQIHVVVMDKKDNRRVMAVVEQWYRDHAQHIFDELFDQWALKVRRHGIEPNGFQIRKMKTRWGSCSMSGNILLNLELVKAPKLCIEYVIVHEMCHIKEHNHGADFYRLMTKLMPDWEERRKKLNQCLTV